MTPTTRTPHMTHPKGIPVQLSKMPGSPSPRNAVVQLHPALMDGVIQFPITDQEGEQIGTIVVPRDSAKHLAAALMALGPRAVS